MDEITTYFVRTPMTEIGALLLIGYLHLRLLVGETERWISTATYEIEM